MVPWPFSLKYKKKLETTFEVTKIKITKKNQNNEGNYYFLLV